MPTTLDQLWKRGEDKARNPGRWTKIKHSGFVHKYKKPDNIAKKVVTLAVEAIPVPFVGTIVDTIVSEAIDKAKSLRNKHKVRSYGSGYNLEKKVKHDIKSLNIQELDRARAKVKSAIEDLNKALWDSDWIEKENLCDHFVDITQSFHYLEKRVELLEVRAKIFEDVGAETRKWCKTVRDSLDDRKTKCDQEIARNISTTSGDLFHTKCNKKACLKA